MSSLRRLSNARHYPQICIKEAETDLSKLCKENRLHDALEAVEIMEHQIPITRNDTYSLLRLVEQEKDLECGRRVHLINLRNGLEAISVLGDHIIRLFAHHGSLLEANQAFEKIAIPSAHTWAAIILANAKLGQGQVALQLFEKMQVIGMKSDKYICVSVLKACAMIKDLLQGRKVHNQIIEYEFLSDVVVGSILIHMYAKCGYVQEACSAFEMLHNRNVVSWNAMVTGYIQNGESLLALECLERMQEEGIMPNAVSWGAIIGGFAQQGHGFMAVEHFMKMQLEGVKPDGVTFLNVLKACATIGDQQQGRLIHGQIIGNNMSLDPALGTTLVDMYAKCGSLVEACKAFDKLPVRNVVSWDTMIEGYVENGQGSLALHTFETMQEEGVKPDEVTFLGVLKACACLGEIEPGRLIHNQISESGHQSDAVGNTLVDMYAKCGSLEEANKVFGALPKRDLVTWNAMISGYAQQGEGLLALDCLNEMEAAGIKPNAISWGARISGYAQHGKGVLALECFEKMQEDGTKPDEFTFSSILKACSSIGAIEKGRLVHQMILKSGVVLDVVLGCTLVDMYAKCGSLNEAYNIFLELPNHNIVSWNAMISGHSQHGECLLAFLFLGKMQEKFIKPNEVTFTSILIACSRAGLVDEGCWHYKYMGEFHVIPTGLHSACMTDLLGRAGYFSDVNHSLWDAIKNDISALTSLLNACKMYGNTDLGKRCFDQIGLLDSSYCTGGYVLMSNIYADDFLQKAFSSLIDVQLFDDVDWRSNKW